MAVEDFTICLDWSTCFSEASLQLMHKAVSKRRQGLGLNAAAWNPTTRTWSYDAPAWTAATYYNWTDHLFWRGLQEIIEEVYQYYVDPTIAWDEVVFPNGMNREHIRPWNMYETFLFNHNTSSEHYDAAYPVVWDGGTYDTIWKRLAEIARTLDSCAFRVDMDDFNKGWRVSTDVQKTLIGWDPPKGGEYLYDYATVEGYRGLCDVGDYIGGNPTTLTPWICEDICAACLSLHKIAVPCYWMPKTNEKNLRKVSVMGRTREEAKTNALAEYNKAPNTGNARVIDKLTGPHDYNITYLGNDRMAVADWAGVQGTGHHTFITPWLLVDLNFTGNFVVTGG